MEYVASTDSAQRMVLVRETKHRPTTRIVSFYGQWGGEDSQRRCPPNTVAWVMQILCRLGRELEGQFLCCGPCHEQSFDKFKDQEEKRPT